MKGTSKDRLLPLTLLRSIHFRLNLKDAISRQNRLRRTNLMSDSESAQKTGLQRLHCSQLLDLKLWLLEMLQVLYKITSRNLLEAIRGVVESKCFSWHCFVNLLWFIYHYIYYISKYKILSILPTTSKNFFYPHPLSFVCWPTSPPPSYNRHLFFGAHPKQFVF